MNHKFHRKALINSQMIHMCNVMSSVVMHVWPNDTYPMSLSSRLMGNLSVYTPIMTCNTILNNRISLLVTCLSKHNIFEAYKTSPKWYICFNSFFFRNSHYTCYNPILEPMQIEIFTQIVKRWLYIYQYTIHNNIIMIQHQQ